MAPAVGFEPTTNRLTADRSTTELRWIALGDAEHTVASPFVQGKRCFGTKEKLLAQHSSERIWLRGLDLNQRPSGYEPDELPGCSTPRLHYVAGDDEIKLKMILRDNHSTSQELAPAVGFEPTTNRLTADRSTTELRWIVSAKKNRRDISCPLTLSRQAPIG